MKENTFPHFQNRVALLIPLLFLVGCSSNSDLNETTVAKEVMRMSKMAVNKYPAPKTVCDPFGGTPDPRSNQGLKAELWWLGAGVSPQHNVSTMISSGTASTQNLFFSELNVPTRLFQMGFASEAGGTVQNDSGNTLIEYFALRSNRFFALALNKSQDSTSLRSSQTMVPS
ncbi:MAG: hypothetical protein IPJ84_20095 [Bdellovibrionales bacterium]|nr:hypothetical protein [Bdellovibrionales bacterium]